MHLCSLITVSSIGHDPLTAEDTDALGPDVQN